MKPTDPTFEEVTALVPTGARHHPAVIQEEMARKSRGFIESLREEFHELRSKGFETRKFDEDLAQHIIYAMEMGLTFHEACRVNNITTQAVNGWRRELPTFSERVDIARIDSYEAMESRCYRIMHGDLSTGDRQRDRDMVKTIQWNMERRGRYRLRVEVDQRQVVINLPPESTGL